MTGSITLLTSAGAVRVAGEGLVIDLREFPETPAIPAKPVTAPGRMTSSPSVRVPHSAMSKAETGRAGGPVCAPVTHSDPAERPSDAIFGERFSHPTSNVTTISSQPAGSVGVPHSKPHKSGKLEVQPAKPLRPHCLHPDLCASGTREHCWSCRKQMAESEAA